MQSFRKTRKRIGANQDAQRTYPCPRVTSGAPPQLKNNVYEWVLVAIGDYANLGDAVRMVDSDCSSGLHVSTWGV